MLVDPNLHPPDHRMKRNIEHIRDFPQADGRGIENAPFDAADVGSIEAALCRQFLLRHAGLIAAIAHGRADSPLLEVGGPCLAFAPLHPEISWCYLESHKPTAYTPHLSAGRA
jgi:hypothetical protein